MVLLIITSSFCIAASPITTSENDEINETVTVEVIKTEAVEEVSFSPKEEVVYQPSQFSSMWNGRVDRCYIDDYICKLVIEELRNRKNYDVIFFTADRYGNYGTPMFQIGNHYFSSGE